ncbi:MAG: LysR family transcriptional regulator [Oscillospiraceae bacterium]|nr:LysR family transcriptional regulator [Oscillospiraceae bacterium]
MNSLQIQYFLHLCQTLSVSETARQLYVVQPAVSKQITALEKELGVVLFDRTNRGVSLTPSGELIYTFLSGAQERFQKTLTQAKKLQTQKKSLTLGLLERLELDELTAVVKEMQRQHPDLEVTLVRLDNPALLSRLSDGRVDAIVTLDHAMDVRLGVQYTELCLVEAVFVISRFHPLADRETLRPRELSGQMICRVMSRQGDASDDFLTRVLPLLHIKPKGFFPVDNLESGLAAVESNDAVALIDKRLQLMHPEKYRFVPTGTYQSVVCAYLEKNNTPLLEELIHRLQEKLHTGELDVDAPRS